MSLVAIKDKSKRQLAKRHGPHAQVGTGGEVVDTMDSAEATMQEYQTRNKSLGAYFAGSFVVGGALLLLVVYMTSSGSGTSEAKFDEVWDIFENDCKCDVSSSAVKKIKDLEKHHIGRSNNLLVTVLFSTVIPIIALLFCYWQSYYAEDDTSNAYARKIESTANAAENINLLASVIRQRSELEIVQKSAKEAEERLKSCHDDEKQELKRKLEESTKQVTEIQQSLDQTQEQLNEEKRYLETKDAKLQDLIAREKAANEKLHIMEKNVREKGENITSAECDIQRLKGEVATKDRIIRQLECAVSDADMALKKLNSQLANTKAQLESTRKDVKKSGVFGWLGWK